MVFVWRYVDLETAYHLCLYDAPFSGTRSKIFYNEKEKVLGRDVEILGKVWWFHIYLFTLPSSFRLRVCPMGISGCCRDLDPVSPMDDCGSGCKVSVTSGRARLTLHRWFDAIAECASWGIDCHSSKGRLRTLVFRSLNLVNLKYYLKITQSGRPRGWFIQGSLRCYCCMDTCIYTKWCRCTFCAYYPPAWANWLLILVVRFTRARGRD